MASPALSRGLRKGLRTLTQVIAGGALTALVNALVVKLDPASAAIVLGAWTALVAFLMNWQEAKGNIPAILPSPGLVTTTAGGALGEVTGTVDVVADTAGDVTGSLIDTTGQVVGTVTGALGLGRNNT